MATTMKLIAKTTLGSDAASVTLGSGGTIPQTYTDLYLVISARSTRSVQRDEAQIRFNSDAANNYQSRTLRGDGANAVSASSTTSAVRYLDMSDATSTSNTFGNAEVYIPNYAGSTKKSLSATSVYETNGTTASIHCVASLWDSTSGITSITIFPEVGPNWASGSSFFLYGITRSDDNSPGTFGIQATGGDVTISGGYKYHVFKSSGTFTVTEPGWVDALVIAGAGGGGGDRGGGGGAGGVRSASTLLAQRGAHNVIVGAGGIGGSVGGTVQPGASGSDSQFLTTISLGGGGGGMTTTRNGAVGGSGGGGSFDTSGGAGTAGQGNAGGNGNQVGNPSGTSTGSGGGGGAGGNGSNGGANSGGAGGAGTNTFSAWTSATGTGVNGFIAGGGGGATDLRSTNNPGAGGSGGGGAGGGTTQGVQGAVNGTANTGSGGGGGNGGVPQTPGANGGSGIIIIRYPVS